MSLSTKVTRTSRHRALSHSPGERLRSPAGTFKDPPPAPNTSLQIQGNNWFKEPPFKSKKKTGASLSGCWVAGWLGGWVLGACACRAQSTRACCHCMARPWRLMALLAASRVGGARVNPGEGQHPMVNPKEKQKRLGACLREPGNLKNKQTRTGFSGLSLD